MVFIESGSKNPYKLVFRVIKFASNHKISIYCSAFTYYEDELPSRLDLGKHKYGGPFKIEEVEDVKSFLGILSVLLATGPAFLVDNIISVNGILTGVKYTNMYPDNSTETSYDAFPIFIFIAVVVLFC